MFNNMSRDNYATWESDDSKIEKYSFFETQFNENKKTIDNQYSRDNINDKLSQRGWLQSAHPQQIQPQAQAQAQNNIYTGRLDPAVHSRKEQMNQNNNNNNNNNIKNNENPILDHQFFNNKGEYKYNEPLRIINSRNFNKK